MRLQDVSTALKAVAEVAHAGEQVVGSIDRARSRGHGFPLLLGVGLGVGLGALLFSESARQQVRRWLLRGSTVQSTVEPSPGSPEAPSTRSPRPADVGPAQGAC